jgi:hypothetical protein
LNSLVQAIGQPWMIRIVPDENPQKRFEKSSGFSKRFLSEVRFSIVLCGILRAHSIHVFSGLAVRALKYEQNNLSDAGNQVQEKPQAGPSDVMHPAPENCK